MMPTSSSILLISDRPAEDPAHVSPKFRWNVTNARGEGAGSS
jgi:hypothetical protein